MSVANRLCQRCGSPLAPEQVFCSNCGTRYVDPQAPTLYAPPPASEPGVPARPPIPPTQYAPPQTPGYGPLPSEHNQQAVPDSAFGMHANYAPPPPNAGYAPYPPPPSPYPGSQGGYNQIGVPVGPPPYAPPLPPPSPPARRNKGLLIALIAGGSLLLLLFLCICGLLVIPKGNSAATKQANSSAGQATTAPTAQPSPASQALFSDTFVDNTKNWDVGGGSGYSASIGNNMLMLKEANHKVFREPLPTNTSYADFSVTTRITLLQGDENDSAGLVMRASSDGIQGYYVDINGDTTYDLVVVYRGLDQKNKAKFLVEPSHTSALRPLGQENVVTVTMKGEKIDLLINNTTVATVSDTTFTSGQMLLFTQNGKTSNGAIASFKSISVSEAPNQVIS